VRADRLAELLASLSDRRAARVIVTGAIGTGKSRACLHAAGQLRRRGARVGGIIAPRVLEAGETCGYDVVDLAGGARRALARARAAGTACGEKVGPRIGRYAMLPGGLALARQALGAGGRYLFVDEVGPWELAGGGLAASLRRLLARPAIVTLTVRPALLAVVTRAFGFSAERVLHAPDADR
jgi:nucleoside-triphosphatase THEP1